MVMMGATFRCNICGSPSIFMPSGDWREAPSCQTCGSSVRMRSVIHALTGRLYGAPRALPDLGPDPRAGLGLSDWEVYAAGLERVFDYRNTFYHQEPRLDISAPDPAFHGVADFLISSDVFEHVAEPVSAAFDGAWEVLRPGGVLILTVPYGDDPFTREHYPGVCDLKVLELGGEWIVVTRAANGGVGLDLKPVFHGGPGSTLEMRLFGLQDIFRALEAAGFGEVQLHEAADPEWGVFPPHSYGLPISAVRH